MEIERKERRNGGERERETEIKKKKNINRGHKKKLDS